MTRRLRALLAAMLVAATAGSCRAPADHVPGPVADWEAVSYEQMLGDAQAWTLSGLPPPEHQMFTDHPVGPGTRSRMVRPSAEFRRGHFVLAYAQIGETFWSSERSSGDDVTVRANGFLPTLNGESPVPGLDSVVVSKQLELDRGDCVALHPLFVWYVTNVDEDVVDLELRTVRLFERRCEPRT